jgi:hypothetical protein
VKALWVPFLPASESPANIGDDLPLALPPEAARANQFPNCHFPV